MKKNKEKIVFVGKSQKTDKKTGKLKMVAAEAPTKITNGKQTILLPSSTEQRTGFTHEAAEFLLSTYPRLYKRKLTKGKKK